MYKIIFSEEVGRKSGETFKVADEVHLIEIAKAISNVAPGSIGIQLLILISIGEADYPGI